MAFGDLLSAGDRAVQDRLGGPVRYRPAFGAEVEVQGVFDVAYRRPDDANLVGVANVGPAVFLRLADLPEEPVAGNPTILVNGISYRVREVQRDGQGGALLHLIRI